VGSQRGHVVAALVHLLHEEGGPAGRQQEVGPVVQLPARQVTGEDIPVGRTAQTLSSNATRLPPLLFNAHSFYADLDPDCCLNAGPELIKCGPTQVWIRAPPKHW
jgi:hypothetical protein